MMKILKGNMNAILGNPGACVTVKLWGPQKLQPVAFGTATPLSLCGGPLNARVDRNKLVISTRPPWAAQ